MKSALLVIDFINDIIHPEGKIASCSEMVYTNDTFAKVNIAINQARKQQLLLVHIKVAFSSDYHERPVHSPLFKTIEQLGALQKDSWGTEFHTNIDYQEQDKVIIKHHISALGNSSLANLLQAEQIEQVIIAGVSTNMAVESTARECHDLGYAVTVLTDACAAANEKTHQSAIDNLAKLANTPTVTQWQHQ